MRVLIVGASGMVGQAVLREFLAAPDLNEVIALGRSKVESAPPGCASSFRTILFDLTRLEPELRGSMPASSAWECLRPE
jgi:nucleoside-diphosphate-sugar epimerase